MEKFDTGNRRVDEIVVHATATRPDWWQSRSSKAKWTEVRRWHVAKPPVGQGWSDIGYHFGIDRDGTVLTGRALSRTGAHVRGRNAHTIGIALFGGFGGTQNDSFSDHYTPEQERSLRGLIEQLRADVPSITKVSGHNEYANKACPCFNVSRWYNAQGPRPFVASTTVQGGMAAGVGLVGIASQTLGDVTSQLQPLAGYSDQIMIAFLVLSVVGILVSVLARRKDWLVRGRK